MSPTHIRRMGSTDAAALLPLWERSVRATHHFLNEPDIAGRNAVDRVLCVDPATAQRRPTGKQSPWAFKPAEYFALVW